MPPNLWFRVLLVLVGLFLLAFGALFFFGSRVPETQSATGIVHVTLTPEETWARLADFESYPRSALSVQSVARKNEPTELPRWEERLSQSTTTWEASEWDEPNRMVQRGQDSVVSQSTVWTFELSPEEDGTRLVATIETTVADGSWIVPIFRLVLSLGATRVALESYLKNTLPDFDAKSIRWEDA